jgi:hypothetical protein
MHHTHHNMQNMHHNILRPCCTLTQVAASVDPLDVQSHASSEAVITVLLHKIMRAARVQVREGHHPDHLIHAI